MLKGTLDDFTLPDIFRLMSLAKKTGRLEVSRGAGEGRVFFNDGDVYYAESSLSREPLGQKLIRARALTESQLNKALDTHSQTGKRVGDIMIESGMVTSEQIEAAVAQQIEDAVFDLLRWDLGEFTWEAGAALEVEVPISVSVENLIMEASRRLDELEVIQRKIPGDHAILMMAHAPPEGAAEINITPEEWRALVLVDGSRTVGEIGSLIGKDDFETMKILYGLVSAGLVEVDHEATAAAAEAAEQEDVEELVEEEVQPEATEEEDLVAETGVEDELPEAEVPEPEVAEAEVAGAEHGGVDDLESLLEDAPEPEQQPQAEAAVEEGIEAPAASGPPAAPPEPEPPDLEIVAQPEAEVAGGGPAESDEAVAFDMSSEELLADEPVTYEPTAEEVSEAASELGTVAPSEAPDLLDALEAPPEPPSEVAVPDEEVGADEAAEAETVSVGDAEDPFLSDLLDQDAAGADAPVEAAEPAVPAPAAAAEAETVPADEGEAAPEQVEEAEEREEEEEGSPTVDRAAVVRELAGLFDEDRPKARPAGPQAPPSPEADAGDQRKRVEDDDQINKGVISRLIKGVKGL